MRNFVRHAHARHAFLRLPEEVLEGAGEEKYPAFVGALIAVGASALLWAIIASIFVTLF
ncbi:MULTISPECIES: hypothetical protein [unclassified Sphingomonas]|uniref:hypothetical protein n=1 Tax=unclassified Sphingomonas TaxID=196159 RepID=UPI000B0B55FE|nr:MULTISPECIES: hypothetical protein [unclassified Sphingomonas]